MQAIKSETLNGILLIIILSYVGYKWGRNAWTVHRAPTVAQSVISNSQNVTFQSEGGVDVNGNLIVTPPPASASRGPAVSVAAKPYVRTLVFLLHGASAAADAGFWSKVQSSLPKDETLRLVGYCDGNTCADAMKNLGHPAFPVIAYGELTDAEALVNADATGNALLRKSAQSAFVRVGWRTIGKTPVTVMQEALK